MGSADVFSCLTILAALVVMGANGQECTVSGATNRTRVNGVYTKNSVDCDGRPSYSKGSTETLEYWNSSTYVEEWSIRVGAVGSACPSTSATRYLYADSGDAATPDLVVTTVYELGDDDATYFENTDISVACTSTGSGRPTGGEPLVTSLALLIGSVFCVRMYQ